MANYLITGVSGGMGSAICRKLIEEGHSVWGFDKKKEQALPEACHFIPADITRMEEIKTVFETITDASVRLDGIIHTAGIYDLASLVEMPEEDFVRDFNVNLFGMFRVNQVFLPLLEKKARIVIISSELAPLHPLPFTGIYAITKIAVERYAAALRMELQLLGHPVIVIRPGAVNTAMLPASTEKLDGFCRSTQLYQFSAKRFRKIVSSVEAKNIPPEKIANVTLQALHTLRPKMVYSINRNPFLLLYQMLPLRLKLFVIRKILS